MQILAQKEYSNALTYGIIPFSQKSHQPLNILELKNLSL